jgi:hypothetical protein
MVRVVIDKKILEDSLEGRVGLFWGGSQVWQVQGREVFDT